MCYGVGLYTVFVILILCVAINIMLLNMFLFVILAFHSLVVFPQDLLEKGLEADNFAMLGLGDIVIPGIFIALLLRFDHR